MSTTALTHRYRPRRFGQIVGQKSAVAVASGMVDKLPPSILITGPHATGKTTIARIMGYRANCLEPKGAEPCGKCASCIQDKNHPDIKEMNAAESRGIETIRHLNEVCRLAPRFQRRMIIMDEAHAMTPQAYQAALKLFEEPPSSTSFVLVTTHPEKMPDTILSRCAKIRLRRVPSNLLAKYLVKIADRENGEVSERAAEYLANASGGHPRDALTMLEQVLSQGGGNGKSESLDIIVRNVTETAPRQIVDKFVQSLLECNSARCFELYEHVDVPDRFVGSVVECLQALLRFSISPKLVDGYWRQACKRMGDWKTDEIADVLKVFGRALEQIRTYVMPADVILDLSVIEATGTED